MSNNFSKLGIWNKQYSNKQYYSDKKVRQVYGDPKTAILAAEWLAIPEIKEVQDWGCGVGGFEQYIANWQKYIGIDGSDSPGASKILDLSNYVTSVDSIHLRHVLEHNELWEKILRNFIQSFTKRGVITIFTPFKEKTEIHKTYKNWQNTGFDMVDITFSWEDIKKVIEEDSSITYKTQFNIPTKTQYGIENIILLKK